MIYTVTVSPSLDYAVRVSAFKAGTVNRTEKEQITPGGKGINVSIVLHNLGFKSTALGFIAGFTGEHIKKMLYCAGIHCDFIETAGGMSRINVKLKAEEETEINGQGAEITGADLEKLFEKLRSLKDGDTLVLAGSIPPSVSGELYMDIMKVFENRSVYIAVDAAKDLLKNVLPYHPFLIKPNNHELGEIFGTELKTREEVIPYAQKLQDLGARNVLVSLAAQGAVLIDEKGHVYTSGAPKGTLVNSVGSGDSMVAGFLAGYLKSGSYAQAFKTGVCAGSASAFSEGLTDAESVERLMREQGGIFHF